jgi:hypothetical protein
MRKRSAVHATRGVITGRRTAGGRKGKIGFHGGKVEIERPRLRGFDGKEQPYTERGRESSALAKT